jgi:hypothetical protein
VCDAELFNFFLIDRELYPRSLHPGFRRRELFLHIPRFTGFCPFSGAFFAA